MTKFSKILAVFVVSASLAFMGFAAVNAIGGTNWNDEVASLTAYDIIETKAPKKKTTYSVKTRRTGEAVGSPTPIRAKAVILARDDMIKKANAEITTLKDEIPKVQSRLKEVVAFIKLDDAAMAKRLADLSDDHKKLSDQIEVLSNDGIKKTTTANKTRAEAERRREDVFRLRSQLDEIQTDLFQIREQKKRLYDLLYQLNGSVEQLKRRKKQLEAAGAKADEDYDEKKVPVGGKP